MTTGGPSPDGRFPPAVRLAIYSLCFAVCALAYVRILPAPVGIIGAAVVPLVWSIEAYRRQSRAAFLFAAFIVFIALVPLIRYLRS